MISDGYDVAIVGGGAAGCVLARRLSEAGDRSVLLIEAGPDPAPVTAALRDGWDLPRGNAWPYDWGFESEPGPGTSASPLRRGRVLGGTSWLTRFAVRGSASDYDAWAARGNAGWAFADVLPTLIAIETDAEFGALDHHGNSGPIHITRYPALGRSEVHQATVAAMSDAGFAQVVDHNAPDAVGVGRMPMSTRDGRRITTMDAYLGPDARPSRLEVRTDTPVDRIVVEKGRAVGVRLVDGTEISASLIVLSAGTYGSPAILMRSGIGLHVHLRDVGVEVATELSGVGSNLADHPGAEVDTGWHGEQVPPSPVLHSLATWRSADQSLDAPPDMTFWVTDPSGPEPSFYLDPILLKPEARGTVRLRSSNPNDSPRITLPSPTEYDLARLEAGYRLATEILSRNPLRGLVGNLPDLPPGAKGRDQILASTYSIPHVVGTCRMGPSPDDGDVVDAAGRVYGVDALYVADASVIPEPPAAFPQVITVMVAERIAAALVAA